MAEKLKCPTCGKECKTKSALTLHIRTAHSDDSLSELLAKYGDMAPRPGGAWKIDRPLTAAPSGVPSIDYAIGIGGVPRGTIIEIFGPSDSGKTFTALTFSAYAQSRGGLAGYVDAEHRLQPTFASLVPGLDLDKLYYAEPKGGEAALNITRDFVSTGLYDIWTVDSVHACTPEALIKKPIGDATMAELAKLMSVGMQALDAVVADTNTVLIFVNHVKSIPGQTYGKDWFKPGGTAMDYYPSVHLHVKPSALFMDRDGRRIGHTVKVKVEKSKVAAPFATAEFDLFYKGGVIKKADHPYNGREVKPGIDMGSCWFSVCEESELIRTAGGRWFDGETGESLGHRLQVVEMLESDCDLRKKAEQLVYEKYASNGKREPAAVGSGS